VVIWHLNYSACKTDNVTDMATSEQDNNRSQTNGGQFPKGESGNPGGRPAITSEVKELARQNAAKAFERIVKLMDDKNPRIALAAASAVLDRAYGKPVPEQRIVAFKATPIGSAKDIASAVSSLMAATANGEMTVSDLRDLAGVLELQRKALETQEIEQRLQKLEAGLP